MCGCGISESFVNCAGNILSFTGSVAFELTLGSCRKISGPMGDRPGLQLTKVMIKTVLVAAMVGILSSYVISPTLPVILLSLAAFRYLISEEFDWTTEANIQKDLVNGDAWYNKIFSKIFEDPTSPKL